MPTLIEKKQKLENQTNLKTSSKLVSLFLGLLLISIVGIASTFAWQSFNQHAFSSAFDIRPQVEVEVIKYEIDIDGEQTTNPVADATFILVDAQTDQQILHDAEGNPIGPTFVTDDTGLITLNLPAGEYCLIEIIPPLGFVPDVDANGDDILRYCFLLMEDDAGDLVLMVDEEEVDRVVIYNRRLSADLEVEKEVIIPEEAALTPEEIAELLDQSFRFYIHFFDDEGVVAGPHAFHIYEGDTLVENGSLYSGDYFYLKHAERAIFDSLPVGLRYEIYEEQPDGFIMSGNNSHGTIHDEDNLAVFTNTYIDEDKDPDPEGTLTVRKFVVGDIPEEICGLIGEGEDCRFEFTVIIDDETFVFDLGHDDEWTSEYLPVGTSFEVIEGDYSYYGIISAPRHVTGQLITGEHVIEVTNHFVPENEGEGELEVEKQVIGELEDDATRFRFTITLEDLPVMHTNDVGEDFAIITIDEDAFSVPAPTWEWEFELEAGASILFGELPAGVRYTVIEQANDDFIQGIISQEGIIIGDLDEPLRAVFRNEVIGPGGPDPEPEETELEVCKVLSDTDAESTEVFRFELWVDGRLHETFELEAWECMIISQLPAGAAYRVVEVDIPASYQLVDTTNDTGTLIADVTIEVEITNEAITVDIPVEKTWNLVGHEGIERPEYIVVYLVMEDIIVERVEIRPDGDDQWNHVFTAPKYGANGDLIQYTVIESPMVGWLDEVEASEEGFVITNTPLLPVVMENLEIRKDITGHPNVNDVEREFEFIIMAVGDAPMPELSTVSTIGAGTSSFGDVIFTKAGVFEYRIREVIPVNQGNFEYDQTIFTVFVTVEVVNGELEVTSVEIFADIDDESVPEVVFVNRYDENQQPTPPVPPTEPPTQPVPPTEPPAQPVPPTEPPAQPVSPTEPPAQSRPPQTGDATPIMFWSVMMGLSTAGLILCMVKKRIEIR